MEFFNSESISEYFVSGPEDGFEDRASETDFVVLRWSIGYVARR